MAEISVWKLKRKLGNEGGMEWKGKKRDTHTFRRIGRIERDSLLLSQRAAASSSIGHYLELDLSAASSGVALRSQLCSRIMQVQVRREYGWRDTRIYNGRGLPRRIVVVWKSLGNAISSLSLFTSYHTVRCLSIAKIPPRGKIYTLVNRSRSVRKWRSIFLSRGWITRRPKWFFLRVSQKFPPLPPFGKFSSRILSFVQPIRLIEKKKKKEGEEKKNWIRFFDHIFVEKYNMSTTFSCTGGFTRKLVFRRIIRKMRRKLQNWSSKYGNWGRDKSSERDICRGSTKYRDLRRGREGRGGS